MESEPSNNITPANNDSEAIVADKSVAASEQGVEIGGSLSSSQVIIGDHNVLNIHQENKSDNISAPLTSLNSVQLPSQGFKVWFWKEWSVLSNILLVILLIGFVVGFYIWDMQEKDQFIAQSRNPTIEIVPEVFVINSELRDKVIEFRAFTNSRDAYIESGRDSSSFEGEGYYIYYKPYSAEGWYGAWRISFETMKLSPNDTLTFVVRTDKLQKSLPTIESIWVLLDDGKISYDSYHGVDLDPYIALSESWQQVEIPLSDFGKLGVDLESIVGLQFIFVGNSFGDGEFIYLDEIDFNKAINQPPP